MDKEKKKPGPKPKIDEPCNQCGVNPRYRNSYCYPCMKKYVDTTRMTKRKFRILKDALAALRVI